MRAMLGPGQKQGRAQHAFGTCCVNASVRAAHMLGTENLVSVNGPRVIVIMHALLLLY